MRDIPVFTTENGVASLIFKEIPYSQTAYVRIQDSLSPAVFCEECVQFCRAVGAEKIFATGHDYLKSYPFHTAIWEMARSTDGLEDTDAAIFPVTEKTLERWREIYNEAMKAVPNASYMTQADGARLLETGDGYFVHRDGNLLGIGKASGERVDAVVSCVPGAGRTVMLALAHAITGERITLQVASSNLRAVKLYEKLDFIRISEVSRWYKIF